MCMRFLGLCIYVDIYVCMSASWINRGDTTKTTVVYEHITVSRPQLQWHWPSSEAGNLLDD